LIVYDQSNDTFTVNGSPLPPNAGVATQPGGRVKAILTPKAAASAPAAGSAMPVAPGASAPASGAGLRSTTTLGGEQRK
jgi:lipopolysaccharide export system protein LptA